MDRWNIVATLNYLPRKDEIEIVLANIKSYDTPHGRRMVAAMVDVAHLTRTGFVAGDISTVMSPRTVICWADNMMIFKNIAYAFKVTFLNKCDEAERPIIAEYFQRCFGEDVPGTSLESVA
jgi:cobaltochelatase CobS